MATVLVVIRVSLFTWFGVQVYYLCPSGVDRLFSSRHPGFAVQPINFGMQIARSYENGRTKSTEKEWEYLHEHWVLNMPFSPATCHPEHGSETRSLSSSSRVVNIHG